MILPTRPALRWHGGKWLLAPWIMQHFPAHSVYVEPFGGAASVLLQKRPIAAECYNDLDGTVVNVFRVLRDIDKARELHRRLYLTPFSREDFNWAYEPPAGDIDGAHKTIVLSFMGHGSDSVTRSCRTGFRTKLTDERATPAQAWKTHADAIPHFTERLGGVVIEQCGWREIFKRFDTPKTLFYLDPPYLHSTRSSLVGRSRKTHGYRHELTLRDHAQLLTAAKRLKGAVVLSGYPSELYDAKLKGWRRVSIDALADGARKRTEVLWLNPVCVAALGHGPLFDQLGDAA